MGRSDEITAPPESDGTDRPDSAKLRLAALLGELTEQLRRGQQPDVKRVASRYPAIAQDLRSHWATVWVAEEMSRARSLELELVSEPCFDSGVKPISQPAPAAAAQGELAPWGEYPSKPASTDLRPDRRCAEYEILEELGRGGMGVVFRARSRESGRIVALKRLLHGPESKPGDLDRFRVETIAASKLAHPHIAPVFQAGECDGQPFFTMQYIEGTTLARKLADGPLPGLEAARLLLLVFRAVQYAHERGVLHRDLKPSNILIDQAGHPCVSDFGLAKRIDVDSMLTPSGALLGTPSYMAPEQAGVFGAGSGSSRRAPLGPTCDVYTLGAILYHMLTGRPPFQATTPVETHHAPVLENWGMLWIYHSIALFVFFGITNGLSWRGVTARWPYVLIFSVGLCGLAAVFWTLRRRGGPIRFVERQLAHIWGAGILAINLIFLVEWLLDLPVLTLAPMIAVTNSMLFMIKGGILSGSFYLQAAATFLCIFPMTLIPRFAPIIFGVVASAGFFVTGLKYRLRQLT